MRTVTPSNRVVTTTGLFIAAALLNGCIIDSSDESVSNSHLVFSYSVTDSQDDESLMIAARVTSRAGLVFFPVNLVGADRLILVGEGGEAEFERSEEPGEYFGAFDAPVRADRWEYRVDLIRQGRRLTTAALDLRTRPTDFVLTYDDETSALQASWMWNDDLRPAPAWRPRALFANFYSADCVYDDGQTKYREADGFPLREANIWQRGRDATNATIPLSSIVSVFPPSDASGTCVLEVRLVTRWIRSLDGNRTPPLVTIAEEFDDASIPEEQRPSQSVELKSESRMVSIRMNDR